MTPWFDIYRERMNDRYRQHVATKYAPFLEALYKTHGWKFTEIGCGAGNVTRILREMHQGADFDYHLIDSCPKMLGLALENNPVPNCTFSCADITGKSVNETSLIHSHGLLEHFDDANIRYVIENMLQCAPVQIHYVPGAKYEQPSRGDERLMSPDQWKHILRRLGRFVTVSTFNDDFDILIKIER